MWFYILLFSSMAAISFTRWMNNGAAGMTLWIILVQLELYYLDFKERAEHGKK